MISSRRVGWTYSTRGGIRNVYKIILFGKPERKKLLRISRYKWEDNIKMAFGKVGWIHLAQDRDW
jgi:hypothetical protein